MRCWVRCGFTLAVIGVVLVHSASAVEPQASSAEEMAELQARMMELAKPGDGHERLTKLAGSWIGTTQMFGAPNATPLILTGDCQNRMILGGRFLLSECGSGTAFSSEPMQSHTLKGFDRRHGRYTVVGFDNLGTYYVTAEGVWDSEQQAIVTSGNDHDPATGITQSYDIIIRIVSGDEYVVEVWFKNPELFSGHERFKMVEATYTRNR